VSIHARRVADHIERLLGDRGFSGEVTLHQRGSVLGTTARRRSHSVLEVHLAVVPGHAREAVAPIARRNRIGGPMLAERSGSPQQSITSTCSSRSKYPGRVAERRLRIVKRAARWQEVHAGSVSSPSSHPDASQRASEARLGCDQSCCESTLPILAQSKPLDTIHLRTDRRPCIHLVAARESQGRHLSPLSRTYSRGDVCPGLRKNRRDRRSSTQTP